MTKKVIAEVIQESIGISRVAAHEAAGDLMDAIIAAMRKNKGFTLPGFGAFKVAKIKARKSVDPRTCEAIKVKAGKTVRFGASPTLKEFV